MQIHPVVLAIALSFASIAAGQLVLIVSRARSFRTGSNANVSVTGVLVTHSQSRRRPCVYNRLGGELLPPLLRQRRLQAHGRGRHRGSFAASLFVLIGAIFLMRYRARKMMVIAVEGGNADLGRRCDRLESEVRGLREQLDRLQTQRLSGTYGSRAVLYTHEKDAEAMPEYGKVKGGKEGPPMYAD
ncbi:hypothetical protein B0H14DRAFT_2726602 [Mycena olivaceomarginata]|nr:hypothetical protein B0H14DRAFT_2726602 [Mycena olivaceomarginata]